MKFRTLAALAAMIMATGALVYAAPGKPACDKKAKTVADKDATPCGAKKASEKAAPCQSHKAATTVADKKGEPCNAYKAKMAAEAAKASDTPCHGKAEAKTVADKEGKPCCAEKLAAAKAKGEDKPCCAKKLAAAKAGDKPCCAKDKAAKAADKPCCAKGTVAKASDTPCHGKAEAKTVADKEGKPCCAEKLAAAKAKGEDKPCCAKKLAEAKTVADKATPCSATKDGEAKTVADKEGCRKKCGMSAKTASAEGGCPISAKAEAVLASMPAMKYEVDGQSYCCSKAATYSAEKTGKPMMYTVGEEKFKTEGEAAAKLVAMLDEELAAMSTIQYSVDGKCQRCPVTAKSIASKTGKPMMYRVAGWDFEDKGKAEEAAKIAAEAAEHVSLAYKIEDGETIGCGHTAEKMKKEGKKVTYIVGDSETCCDAEAKILLSQAKARAMIEAAGHVAL